MEMQTDYQRPLRILFVTGYDIAGLASTTPIEITRAMRCLGCEVEPVFLCHDRKGDFQDVSPMYLLNYKRGSYFSSLLMYLKLMLLLIKNVARYDYVLVDQNSALSLVPLAILRSIFPFFPKIVLDVRSQPVEVPDNWRGSVVKTKFALTIKAAARHFNGLLAITDAMGNYLKEIADIRMPIGIWTSGVNLDLFNPDKNYESNFAFKDRFVLVYHGVFSPTRGLDRIVSAIEEIRLKHPSVLLCLLGNGAMRGKLEQMIVEKDLGEHVIIRGPFQHSEIPQLLAGAHVGILAFPDHEWWSVQSPLKLFEYLAMGIPVIASDIPMNRNVIGERNIGFYIRDNSVEQICKGIETAINNRDKLPDMGMDGRRLIEAEYSWRSQAEKVLNYIQKL